MHHINNTSRRYRRRELIRLASLGAMALVAFLLITPIVNADSAEAQRVAKIKSAYLLNFLRFTDWPPHVFERADSPVEICIVGDDSLGAALDDTVREQAIARRPIKVLRMNSDKNSMATMSQPGHCHLVFISISEAPRLSRILANLRGSDTLTVGETGSFAANGTMLALNLESDRIIFYANPDVIRAGKVDLSSKILQLARIVDANNKDHTD